MFSWKKIKKPVFALAPMANITTMPFSSICKEMGADIVYSPMISSNAVIHNREKTLKIAEFLPKEQPAIVQVFGYDGNLIADAANIINKKLKPAGIDINLGCPAPKIAKNECGAALLEDYDKAKKIIRIVRDNFNGELSVKLRLGWDKFDVIPFIKYLEKIGINCISVHGRTAKQGYSGKADWQAIYKIAENVKIPVIGNGDVTDAYTAYRLLLMTDGNLTGIMIGRAALGNPWIFKDIKKMKDLFFHSSQKGVRSIGAPVASNGACDPLFVSELTSKELANIIDKQTKRYIKFAGEKMAILEMRKHLGWYIKGFEGAQSIRKAAVMSKTYKDVLEILKDIRKIK
jgi:nifR3 family TIM-barrel protein